MMQLTTKQLYIPQVAQPQPPAQSFTFPKPLSYEFRVAEVVNDQGKIETVKLQMQVWEHDEFGVGNVKQYWSDVPRVKFDKNGSMLTTV